jgi:hypothetical protein
MISSLIRRYGMAQSTEKPNLEIGFSVDTEITFSYENRIYAREIMFFSNGEKVILHDSTQSGTYVIDAGTSIQAYECTRYRVNGNNSSTAIYNSDYMYFKDMEVNLYLTSCSCEHLHVENCHFTYHRFNNVRFTDVTIINCTGITAFHTSYGVITGNVVLNNNPQMTNVTIYDYKSTYLKSINVSNCENLKSVDLTGYSYVNYSALKEMTFVNCPNLRTIKSHALSFVTDNEQGLLAFAESLPIIPEGETGTCAIQAIPDGNAKQIIINKGWTIL